MSGDLNTGVHISGIRLRMQVQAAPGRDVSVCGLERPCPAMSGQNVHQLRFCRDRLTCSAENSDCVDTDMAESDVPGSDFDSPVGGSLHLPIYVGLCCSMLGCDEHRNPDAQRDLQTFETRFRRRRYFLDEQTVSQFFFGIRLSTQADAYDLRRAGRDGRDRRCRDQRVGRLIIVFVIVLGPRGYPRLNHHGIGAVIGYRNGRYSGFRSEIDTDRVDLKRSGPGARHAGEHPQQGGQHRPALQTKKHARSRWMG